MPLWIDPKHVAKYKTSLDLILWYIEYIACPRFGFDGQQDAIGVIDGDDVG